MSTETTYQAARAVAETAARHFAHHVGKAGLQGVQGLATPPPAEVIEKILDIAFWSSLRREEGISPKISLAFLSPKQAKQPLLFRERLPLSAGILTKLAPGVERPGIHLGVWQEREELYVWGTTRIIPDFCFVLDVSEPGLLVVKHRRLNGFGKFANVAVLIGDQVKVVNEESASVPDCPGLLSSLLGFNADTSLNASLNVFVQLAVSMRAHGRGGSLLVVPSGTKEWNESMVQPLQYAIEPAFCALAELMLQDEKARKKIRWQSALRREVESIAGLTAIDGATVISDRHELLAFGAKIGRRMGSAPVEQMILTEPILGGEATVIQPSQNGGTRHLSAAQFVHDQRDALAMIASQDGRFTIFSWSPCENMLQAHRIDTLLL